MELCTGFEPVIPVLQTGALTNLANRAKYVRDFNFIFNAGIPTLYCAYLGAT